MILTSIPKSLKGSLNITNHYEGNSHISSYVATSDHNEFIPLHSLNDGELLTYKSGKKSFIYNLDTPIHPISTGRVSRFCDNMFAREDNVWCSIDNRNIIKNYYCYNGMLVHIEESSFKPIPLILMAVKKDSLFSLQRDNLDYSKLCLVVDRKFINDEEHYKLYRNIKKYYIDVVEKEIDSHYTNDILNVCYNSGPIILPKFRTIPEMLEYTDSINTLVSNSLLST